MEARDFRAALILSVGARQLDARRPLVVTDEDNALRSLSVPDVLPFDEWGSESAWKWV